MPPVESGVSLPDRMQEDPSPAPGYSWPELRGPFVICNRCAGVVALDLDNPPHPRGSGVAVHDAWHREHDAPPS